MKQLSDLRLLVLAVLQHNPEPISKYRLMIKINQLIDFLLPPYSPGACYHEIASLAKDGMIIINQNRLVGINEAGLSCLMNCLANEPLPQAMVPVMVRAIATALLTEAKDRDKILARLKIEMIKYNQYSTSLDRPIITNNPLLNKWLRQSRQTLSSLVTKLGDEI